MRIAENQHEAMIQALKSELKEKDDRYKTMELIRKNDLLKYEIEKERFEQQQSQRNKDNDDTKEMFAKVERMARETEERIQATREETDSKLQKMEKSFKSKVKRLGPKNNW